MADYPLITLISQIDVNTPSGGESASKLDDSIRQIKSFLVSFLGVAHADGGAISSVATSGISDGSVTTSKIFDLAVTTAKIADLAITAAKIANGTITATQLASGAIATAQLADLSVSTAKLIDVAVTTAKIANAAITATQLAANAVTTAGILDANVTNAKLAAASVSPDKFSNIGTAKIPVGDGTSAVAASVGGALTMTLVGTTATFALSGVASGFALAYAAYQVRATSGTGGGSSLATSYQDRGPFNQVFGSTDLFGVSTNDIILKKAGTYLITAFAIANSVHRTRLYNATAAVTLATGLSTSSGSPGFVQALITTTADNTSVRLQDYTVSAVATTGLGAAVSSGEEEIYAQVEVIKF